MRAGRSPPVLLLRPAAEPWLLKLSCSVRAGRSPDLILDADAGICAGDARDGSRHAAAPLAARGCAGGGGQHGWWGGGCAASPRNGSITLAVASLSKALAVSPSVGNMRAGPEKAVAWMSLAAVLCCWSASKNGGWFWFRLC